MLDRIEQLEPTPILCAVYCVLIWDEFFCSEPIDTTE